MTALPYVAYMLAALDMARVNLVAPFYRDAGIFLFMANNIRHGQPPYWATWDTKNPLVEYYWALVAWPFKWLGIVEAARVAEGIWIAATATAASLMLRWLLTPAENGGTPPGEEQEESIPAGIVAFAAGFAVIFMLSHWQWTDGGLYLPIYQALPEMLALVVAVVLVRRNSVWLTVLFGVFVFAAWWIKQTSLLTLALPLALTLIVAWRQKRLKAYLLQSAGGAAVFFMLLVLFLWRLQATDTLQTYLAGTHGYNSEKVLTHLPEALDEFKAALLRPGANSMIPTSATFLVLTFWLVAEWVAACWRRTPIPLAYPRLLCLLWLAGSLAQAYLPMTLLPSYFFACWTPAIVALCLFACSRPRSTRAAGVVAFVLLLAISCGIGGYGAQAAKMRKTWNAFPLLGDNLLVSAIVPPAKRVFVWGGMMHYHVLNDKQSDYPKNMWYSFIAPGVNPEDRDRELRDILEPDPPDYVIMYYETYKKERGMTSFPVDPAILKAWTGREYRECYRKTFHFARVPLSTRVFALRPSACSSDPAQPAATGPIPPTFRAASPTLPIPSHAGPG